MRSRVAHLAGLTRYGLHLIRHQTNFLKSILRTRKCVSLVYDKVTEGYGKFVNSKHEFRQYWSAPVTVMSMLEH